jgi:DNA replication protein DnaC
MTPRGWANVCLDCKFSRARGQSGFPLRYSKLKLADCLERPGNKAALAAARRWSENGDFNLLFLGSPGTGKTHIAAAAAWSSIVIPESEFHSVPEVLLKFQASVKEHEELTLLDEYTERETSIFNDPGTKSRLFDDVGAHRVSDFSIEMFGIILERYYSNNATGLIFTSNLTKKQILETMGERVASRLCGLAEAITLEGADIRLSGI